MLNGRRQPSHGGTSRMTRECQVRFCERLGVKFPGPTRQNPNTPHSGLCQLPPAADMPLNWLMSESCRFCCKSPRLEQRGRFRGFLERFSPAP